MGKRAETDDVITDEATGLEHKVFAGQPIPGHLLSEEDKDGEEAVGGGTSTGPSDVKVADSDETRTDPVTGLEHKVFAGQPIPANLLSEDEQEQVEEPEEEDDEEEDEEPEPAPTPQARQSIPKRRSKVQVAPDKER